MLWFQASRSICQIVDSAISIYGAAAEAHLNYPLQDPNTSEAARRELKAALREIRRRKRAAEPR